MESKITSFSVFTKPWPELPGLELGKLVRRIGFDAIELPIRPGFQVTPENVETELPLLTKALADEGIKIGSVSGPLVEPVFAACAAQGISLIRLQFTVDKALGYMASEARLKDEFRSLLPLCRRYGVKIGVQNHIDCLAYNASGLRQLISEFDSDCVGAVWDAAHAAVCGENPEHGLDIAWSHLCLVNLKNAYWHRTNGPEAKSAEWSVHWTTGKHGISSWPRVAAYLKQRGYVGSICLTAQYTAHKETERLVAEDLAYAKSLFE